MKNICIALFLFITISLNAKQVYVSVEAKNIQEAHIQFELIENPLMNELRIYRMNLRSEDMATYVLPVTRPQMVLVKHANAEFEVFLEPGKELTMKFNSADVLNSIRFEGEGGTNNKFLVDFQRYYDRPQKKKYEKGGLETILNRDVALYAEGYDIATFYNQLTENRQNQDKFLRTFNSSTPLTPKFKSFIQNHIRYNYEAGKLAYFVVNQGKMPASVVQQYWTKYQLLGGIDVNDSKAIDHPAFQNLLNAFIQYLYAENPFDVEDLSPVYYNFITKNLKGKAQSFMLTRLFINIKKNGGNLKFAQKKFPAFKRDNPYPEYTTLVEQYYGPDIVYVPEEVAPDFSAIHENGKRVRLSDYQGKVVYMSFWASWCKPCLAGFKKTYGVRKQLKDKGVVLLNICMDRTQSAWKNTMSKVPMPGENIFVENMEEVQRLYDISSLPLYHILNKQGRYTYLSENENRNIISEFEALINGN